MTISNVWVLGDNRTGNRNQAIALAERISANYKLKNITYNYFSKLPNFLLSLNPIHIENKILKIDAKDELPDIIISSGRRTAPVALYLKRKFNRNLQIIQIMRPNLSYNQFDIVILPQHDKLKSESLNILRINGALNNIYIKLPYEANKLRINYPEIKNFIAVIIGGNSKNYNFTIEDANIFVLMLLQIIKNQSIDLFISFSRRTPDIVKQIIKKQLPASTIIYDPSDKSNNIPNPYLGMIAAADYIIATADSISMCSEAASSGKPLYIFYPHNLKSRKHRFFVQQLVELKIAKFLDESVYYLKSYNYVPLNEVARIELLIKLKLGY